MMQQRQQFKPISGGTCHKAIVLLVVLVILSMSSMIAVGLMFRVRAENGAFAAMSQYSQAELAAYSGLRRACNFLVQYEDEPELWRDNPDYFLAQDLWFDGVDQWSFTVYSPDPQAQDGLRYGLSDEAEKINLHSANAETLLALGLLDGGQTDCLLDYIDPDDQSERAGAEQDFYDRLDQPYTIANGPLATTEQILMAHSIDSRIVYGEDTNLNSILDANENDGDGSFPDDNADGQLNLGLSYYTTAFSRPVIDGELFELNNSDPTAIMSSDLPDNTMALVAAYVQDGNFFEHPVDLLEMSYTPSGMGSEIVSDVTADNIDLLHDILTKYKASPPKSQFVGVKKLSIDMLLGGSVLYDRDVPGGVNVMTAPVEILELVGNMGPSKAADIVRMRDTIDAESARSPAWLLEQGIFEWEEFKEIAPMLTCGSKRFRMRCVGYARPSGRYCVLEAIVDISGSAPQVVYLRDLTRFGLPFAISE